MTTVIIMRLFCTTVTALESVFIFNLDSNDDWCSIVFGSGQCSCKPYHSQNVTVYSKLKLVYHDFSAPEINTCEIELIDLNTYIETYIHIMLVTNSISKLKKRQSSGPLLLVDTVRIFFTSLQRIKTNRWCMGTTQSDRRNAGGCRHNHTLFKQCTERPTRFSKGAQVHAMP